MSNSEIILIISLISVTIILFIINILIQKNKAETIINKFKEIDNDGYLIVKQKLIKRDIDSIYNNLLQEKIAECKEIYIKDAISKSVSVSKGKIIEHFAPFLLANINPNEIVFMGSPIDLISFTNIDNGKELSIDFLEIKSGNATLNKRQRLIRNAIIEKRVFYKKVKLE